MKRTIATVLLTLMVLATGSAIAGSIKSWSGGDVLTSADLNANFSHIHGTMVGGHGARLVNADVSASAAIAHSKLATPGLVPKAASYLAAVCSAGTCTQAMAVGATMSVVFSSTGLYGVSFSVARTDANYAVFVNSHTIPGTTAPGYCYATDIIASGFNVRCYDGANPPAGMNSSMSIMVIDNDN